MPRSTPTNKKPIDLSYAIREIIIVSIGILIAFGINTCSSNLSQSRKYKEYTKSLIADLDENLKNIDAILNAQQKKVTDLNRLVDMLEQQKYDIETLGDILFFSCKRNIRSLSVTRGNYMLSRLMMIKLLSSFMLNQGNLVDLG